MCWEVSKIQIWCSKVFDWYINLVRDLIDGRATTWAYIRTAEHNAPLFVVRSRPTRGPRHLYPCEKKRCNSCPISPFSPQGTCTRIDSIGKKLPITETQGDSNSLCWCYSITAPKDGGVYVRRGVGCFDDTTWWAQDMLASPDYRYRWVTHVQISRRAHHLRLATGD